jgi:L-lactate dehydrogenase (cytochrome)
MNTYSLEQVSHHNSKDDCWIVIDDGVYDITDFIPIHPGGKTMIFRVAGQDATEYFHELHQPKILDLVGKDYFIGRLHMAKI